MTAPELKLISILRARQEAEGLSDVKFSRAIGSTQGHWWRVKRAQRGIGKHLAQGILARYPELWREVQDALLTGGSEDAA